MVYGLKTADISVYHCKAFAQALTITMNFVGSYLLNISMQAPLNRVGGKTWRNSVSFGM